MHPDIKRDINQKVRDGLLSTKDSRLLLKYLAERQNILGFDPLSLYLNTGAPIPWAELNYMIFQGVTMRIISGQTKEWGMRVLLSPSFTALVDVL